MKDNIGLVEFVKKAMREGWGYVYGTFGTMLTEGLLASKLRQYPQNIEQYEAFIRTHWMGKRVADCVGLIKAYMWWSGSDVKYTPASDVSANGMLAKATKKGPIAGIPEVPGVCVWKNGHIGVYIGGGQVIESKGTKYGVVQTPLKGVGATRWTQWLECPFIEYKQPEAPEPENEDSLVYTVKRGDTLSKIGTAFGLPWQKIATDNKLANPGLLTVGQKLTIKFVPKLPAPYTVKRGDTLGAIAKRYGYTVAQLAKHNRILIPGLIRVGQVIKFPAK